MRRPVFLDRGPANPDVLKLVGETTCDDFVRAVYAGGWFAEYERRSTVTRWARLDEDEMAGAAAHYARRGAFDRV